MVEVPVADLADHVAPAATTLADYESLAAAVLKALDTDRRVVYLGSFAKTGLPGARVGYVVADQLP